ncbi:MAG: peroxiredoxin family protein, partial [Holophagales bacterium]|nr:peroxiredoxin family protein [Holophagales bacterium]
MERRVGTRFGGMIFAACMLLGVAGCGGGGGERAIEVGERAPDFSLVGLDGMRRSLASYRGQPLVLNFWAT